MFTEKEKQIVLQALNAMLKADQNALEASQVIVPIAVKVSRSQAVEEKPDGNANS